jgi:hypothetical protein
MLEKEAVYKNKLSASNKGLGFSQAFELGQRSHFEYVSHVPLPPDYSSLFDNVLL